MARRVPAAFWSPLVARAVVSRGQARHVFWVFGPGYGDHANRRTFQPRRDGRMHSGTESGLVGGGVLGQIVTSALPSVVASAQSGNLSIGGIVSQVIAGGTGGAILTAIIGGIKNKAAA